jgi:hypothetical protein
MGEEKRRVKEGPRHQRMGLHGVVSQRERTEGTKYFFLSMVGMSVLSAFSHITCPSVDTRTLAGMSIDQEDKRTGMRSGYFWRMRSASALRFSRDEGEERTMGSDRDRCQKREITPAHRRDVRP